MALLERKEKVKRPYKRRHYFINWRLQGRFIFFFLVLGFLIVSGTSALIWRFSSMELDKFIYRSHIAPMDPWTVVFPILMKSLVISAVVLIMATYLFTRLLFRRMSSAMATFNEALIRIGSGDLKTRVTEGGVDDLNKSLDSVRDKLRGTIISLSNLQTEMAREAAKTEDPKEGIRGEIERLCGVFRRELADVYEDEYKKR